MVLVFSVCPIILGNYKSKLLLKMSGQITINLDSDSESVTISPRASTSSNLGPDDDGNDQIWARCIYERRIRLETGRIYENTIFILLKNCMLM